MLILPIKKKWYDMILSGEKKEEYREIKQYYKKRFSNILIKENSLYTGNLNEWLLTDIVFSLPVMFRNGYSSTSPSFTAICELVIDVGNPDWGAEPGKKYYVLKIKEIGRK